MSNQNTLGNYVLCQNCLKALPFTRERHIGDELCDCGGDFCGCTECSDDAELLINKSENQ